MFAVIPLLVAMFACLSSPLVAQTFFGSIVGTVTDSSGAVVPSATVTVTNIGTNEKHAAQTDAAGNYRFVSLLPANYKVEVEAANFKRFSRSPIAVQVGATARVDSALEVGAATEVVQVTTQAPLLNTESGSMSSEVEGERVQEMPINGRNTMNLIALVPGVVPQGSSQGSTGMNQGTHTNPQGWSNYQIGGGIAGQSAMYLDGAALNVLGNSIALVPTQDSIQEFNVAINSVSADFGRFGGGVVNMTTKSGTNNWHGSAYEYLRNNVFNANDYFSNQTPDPSIAGSTKSPRPKWNVNQYGVVANGPIVKDKAFFLFTWEGLKSRLGNPSPTNVPTTDMQNGVFTKPISDPLGNCNIAHDATAGTWTITNLWQGACGDSTAKVLRGYYPAPNNLGAADNYFSTPVVDDNQNQYNARVDYKLGTNQQLFGRYTYWSIADTGLNEFNSYGGYDTANGRNNNQTQQVVLGDTYTLNASTILDLRLSYLRQTNVDSPADLNVNESQFGTNYAALGLSETAHGLPAFQLNGPDNFYSFSSLVGLSIDRYNNYAVSANLIKMLRSHSLKFGVEARLMQNNATGFVLAPSGFFNISPDFTGDEWASFLMGYQDLSMLGTGIEYGAFNYYQAYYATDTWQVNRNLTLNLGVRWELPGSVAEKHDRDTVLLPHTIDPYTGYTGTLGLVNSSLYGSRGTQKTKYDLFAPRVGFAYRLGSNMAIRGGYGISYLPPDLTGVLPGNSPVTSDVNIFGNFAAMPVMSSLSNPFPHGINQPAGRTANFMTQQIGQSVSGADPNNPFPYAQQWNLSLSRQMKGDWMVEAAYSGLKGTHLPGPPTPQNSDNLDELQSKYWSQGVALLNPADPTNPHGPTVGQSLRPYPQYQNFADSAWYVGDTTYHALNTKLEKRFGSGGVLMAGYTWAKMIGNTDTSTGQLEVKATPSTRTSGNGQVQDYNNLRGERSILSYNLPQRLVVSYVLNLPFGEGQKYAQFKGVGGAVVSGWAVNGISTFQSGFPLALQMASGNNLTNDFGAGQLRPDYTPSASGCNGKKTVSGSAHDRLGEWFNTACFQAPGTAAGTVGWALGSESRVDSALSGEGMNNFDVSILKSTKIWEKTNLQFRAELFNIFNRVQFAPPVIQQDASNFGQILSQGNQPRLVQFSLRLNY
jgi:hypothetical protein